MHQIARSGFQLNQKEIFFWFLVGTDSLSECGYNKILAIVKRMEHAMSILRTIQKVSGATLTIAVPADWVDQDVEVIIQPIPSAEKSLPPEQDPRYARFIIPKLPLTEEDKKLFEINPYPLRGTGGEFIDPFEPAVPPEDWDVYREDAEV